MCLQCNNAVQPRHCHTVTYCAEDEVCFVEKVESMFGVRYNMGCLQDRVCREQNQTNIIKNSGEGNPLPYTCTECCQADLCNAEGCGEPGYPVARGPICFACSQHDDSRECRQIAHCRDSELCYIKKEEEFGDQIYSTGCMPFQQCLSVVQNTLAIGHLSNSHHFSRPSTTGKPTGTIIDTTVASFVTDQPTGITDNNIHMINGSTITFPPNSTVVPTGITESSIHMIDESTSNSPHSTQVPTGITDSNIHMIEESTSNLPHSTQVPTGITDSNIHMIEESTSNSPHSTQVPTGITDSNIHMIDESSTSLPFKTKVPTGITDNNIHMVDGLSTGFTTTPKIVPTGITEKYIHMVDGSSKSSPTQSTPVSPDITEISILSDQTNFLAKEYIGIWSSKNTKFQSPSVMKLTHSKNRATTLNGRQKRFISCHQCCRGDLCNEVCSPSSPLTPTPDYFTISPPSTPTSSTDRQSTTAAILTSTPTTSTPTTSTPTSTTSTPTTSTSTTSSPTSTTSTPTTTSSTTTTNSTTFPVIYTGLSGTEFLLALSKHKNLQDADNVSLVITSPDNGRISVYLENTKSFINITLTKGRNAISLDPSIATSVPWNEQKGIYVKSNVNISVHIMEYKNGSDTAFSVIPVSDLSNRYVAATAKGTNDNPSFITVVALHNNTKVRFNLRLEDKNRYVYISPWRNYRYENGESFNITLNQYETFQLEVNGTDLTGTVIDSSKPVAVFSGAESTVIPSTVCTQDCETQKVIQMLPPTDALGTDFIIPKLQNRHTFTYKIVSSEDGTQVTVNGKIVYLPTVGSFKEFETKANTSIAVSSNKPILVVQMTETMKSEKENASGAMLVTPAIQQLQSDYHFSIPDGGEYSHFLSIVIRKGQEGALVLDGKPYSQINATMETVDLNGQPYAVINIPLNQHDSHDIENLQGSPFGLMAYGFKHNQGYGYPVALKLTH
ncbi:mucin-5AC-like [Saccostrea echinata]|uniref:mucin-5AC-like n=1 Tax=Saccostrea echinata TaxID=191078 RepID=UPI002A7EAB0C|nr:mucin-5AC-like [Saccostrea echinata]